MELGADVAGKAKCGRLSSEACLLLNQSVDSACGRSARIIGTYFIANCRSGRSRQVGTARECEVFKVTAESDRDDSIDKFGIDIRSMADICSYRPAEECQALHREHIRRRIEIDRYRWNASDSYVRDEDCCGTRGEPENRVAFKAVAQRPRSAEIVTSRAEIPGSIHRTVESYSQPLR